MDVFRYCHPVARKDGRCTLCGGVINKGEKYDRWAYADGGRASSIKAHHHCNLLLSKYLDGDTEFDLCGFEDWIRDTCEENNLCRKDMPLSEKVLVVYEFIRC